MGGRKGKGKRKRGTKDEGKNNKGMKNIYGFRCTGIRLTHPFFDLPRESFFGWQGQWDNNGTIMGQGK